MIKYLLLKLATKVFQHYAGALEQEAETKVEAEAKKVISEIAAQF